MADEHISVVTREDTRPLEVVLSTLMFVWGATTLSPAADLGGAMWRLARASAPEMLWAWIAIIIGLVWLGPILRGGWWHMRRIGAFSASVYWFGLVVLALQSNPSSTFTYQMVVCSIAAGWCSWQLSHYRVWNE